MRRLGAQAARLLFAALVLGLAVNAVIRRLRRGQRSRIGVCSALAAAVVTRRRGDALTPIITWSLVFLVADTTLARVTDIVALVLRDSRAQRRAPAHRR